jgi:hypothetical protein
LGVFPFHMAMKSDLPKGFAPRDGSRRPRDRAIASFTAAVSVGTRTTE